MSIGPVQLLVIGFDEPQFSGAIREELERLREHDVVRLVDVLLVHKHEASESPTDSSTICTSRRKKSARSQEP